MREKNYKEKSNLFSGLSGREPKIETGELPYLVQRRIKGYNTGIAAFLIFGFASWAISRSVFSIGLGIFMAAILWILAFFTKKQISDRGIEEWQFKVVEPTRITPLNRRPTGLYAEALDGPYEGYMCHISVSGLQAIPPEGQTIKLFVLKGTEANSINNIFYIPQHYGLNFVGD